VYCFWCSSNNRVNSSNCLRTTFSADASASSLRSSRSCGDSITYCLGSSSGIVAASRSIQTPGIVAGHFHSYLRSLARNAMDKDLARFLEGRLRRNQRRTGRSDILRETRCCGTKAVRCGLAVVVRFSPTGINRMRTRWNWPLRTSGFLMMTVNYPS
jgi:hypothetical protein